MGIDLKKIRAGEKIACPLCRNGYFVPMYGASCKDAPRFQCTSCKEKLSINISSRP